ncbi:MAG: TolC family protein [Planctomycetota bacterium]|nr:TolC family protein [Planctomycetota bacterium]
MATPAASTVGELGSEQVVTLGDLEQIAFQNNPTLARASARMQAAQGRQVQASLYPNPVVGYHATEIGNLGTAGQQGAFVSQRFITAGKLGLDQAIVGKEIDEAHFRFHGQEQRVLSDVRVRFYDALVAQKRVELTKTLTRIGDELVQSTEKLLEGRLATDNDLLQAEIRADESRILFDNARNQQIEAWRRLAAVVGMPQMQMATASGELTGELPQLEWDSCCATVLAGNPELNAAQARLDRAEIVIRRAKKEPIPNVDLFVSVRKNNISGSDNANVQLGIPIPIFDRNQGNVAAAEADWVAASKEVQRIELDLQDRLAVAFRRYSNARQQVDRYGRRMVPRAKKSLDLVTQGYQKGQVKYLTALTAQQTYVQVSLSYLDSLQELRVSSSVIDGQLLTGSLASQW